MVKPPTRTKSIGFKVSEDEYAQLETAAQRSGQSLGEWCREAAVLASGNGEPPQAATGPGGAGVQADFANALMAEVVALRAILLNVLFKVANDQPLTAEEMQRLIDRADADKLTTARERLAQAAEPEQPKEKS
jgi:hypothetical protein